MSIIPLSCLSNSDLAALGNNLRRPVRKGRREVRAANRSLAVHGEAIQRLHRRVTLPDPSRDPRHLN